MVQIDDYIKKWSEKLGISEDDIKKDYNKLVEEEKKIHSDTSQEEQETRALQRLAMFFKKQLRSPAVGFEGMIIGAGDVIDFVAKRRTEAIKLFEETPQLAISQGITNDEGVPLETRVEWSPGNPNKSYGHPLPEHSWGRTVYGVATRTNTDDAPKFFIMNMRGEIARKDNIAIFQPIKFRANDKSQEGDSSYTLNSSVFTKFEVDTSLNLPIPTDLINKYCDDMKVDLSDLEAYHIDSKDNFNRIAIIEGDVSTLVLEPTSVGSRRLVIEDESNLEDLEAKGITCWIPKRINLDFGEQSKVIIVGRTSQGKKRDENGNATDEPGDIMINAFGVYAIPEYKIEADIEEITEENTETTDTKTDDDSVQTNLDNW